MYKFLDVTLSDEGKNYLSKKRPEGVPRWPWGLVQTNKTMFKQYISPSPSAPASTTPIERYSVLSVHHQYFFYFIFRLIFIGKWVQHS